MIIDEIQQIFNKYATEELKIENILSQREIQNEKIASDNISNEKFATKNLSVIEAKQRNKQILKDLEVVKGNLRSKAIFSPSEIQWEQICSAYRDNPSMIVTTYRCHLPIFV